MTFLSHLNNRFQVVSVYPHGNPHEHVLGTLGHFPVDSEQIGPLQSLETKVLIAKVTVIDNGRIEKLYVCVCVCV